MSTFNKEDIQRIILEKTALIKSDYALQVDTLLYASNGILSSIELVMLIVDVEQEIRRKYNLNIVIASARAMSEKNSPFNNVNSFTIFIFDELNKLNSNHSS